jgi:hypothetical protein
MGYEQKRGGIVLQFGGAGGMNQVLRKGARKAGKQMINNAETTHSVATVAEQGATVAPQKTASKKAASRKKGVTKALKIAKRGQVNKPAMPSKKGKVKPPRTESKGMKILELIGRANGATLAEIMSVVGWQAHSVRGFISTAGKKGLRIDSSKNDAGYRVYRSGK